MSLHWGRRYVMCDSLHYGVLYEINPWMHREVPADPDRSREQWEALVATLLDVGATVETIDAVEDLPDMVFTANAGIVDGDRFIVSRFRHPERSGEEKHFASWFAEHGAAVTTFEDLGDHRPDPHTEPPFFEGAGDALPFAERLLAGYAIRSDFDAHTALAAHLGVEVLSVQLTDPRFYHLDLTFCPLSDRHALIVPEAWDAYGRDVVSNLVPEPIVLEPDEALAFCANSVVVDTAIVMPSCTPRLGRELERIGLEPVVSSVDEFLKAGGGVRCLTLALDVSLARRN